LQDVFSQFFNSSGRGGAFTDLHEDLDLHAEIGIPFEVALRGGKQLLTLQGERNKKISVTIPAGIEDGKKIRLSGQGRASSLQGEAGDLIITVHVQPHPQFRRQGLDVYLVAHLNVAQAVLGSTLTVPTVYGHTVEIKIPAGTQNEKLFKLKGLGVKTDQVVGDFYVEVRVEIPQQVPESAQETMKKFAVQMGMKF